MLCICCIVVTICSLATNPPPHNPSFTRHKTRKKTMLHLDLRTSVLVLIDLQKGVATPAYLSLTALRVR